MINEEYVVSAERLSKEFDGVTAVDDISFSIARGRVVGFLGPNGAGKTTTLRMLMGLLRPTRGNTYLFGHPYADLRSPMRRVGSSLESATFVPGRTGRNHLRIYAGHAGCSRKRVDELLEVVDLEAAAKRPVSGYSTGMKQRLSLATALLGDPELLVLDEPANGLDPDGIRWLRRFLRDFAASGKTVLLSSHLLGEMEQTVDDVLLLNAGRLVYSGDLDRLKASVPDGPGDLESAFVSLTHDRGEAGS